MQHELRNPDSCSRTDDEAALTNTIGLAFVGSAVPDAAEFRNDAFSRAGQMSQENLLLGLKHGGLYPSLVISVPPLPAFPRSRRLLVPSGETRLQEEIPVKLLGFVNITPLKQLLIGLGTVWELVKWRSRTSHFSRHVVYTYNLSVPPGLFTLIGARLIGAKAVVSLYDINVPGETVPNRLLTRFDFWLHRKLIPTFDGHVAICDAIMHDFAPGKKYLRMEGGVSKALFETSNANLPRQASSNSRFVIVFAGSLHPANGIDLIINAFSLLVGDRYQLTIAGRGSQQGIVSSAAQKDSRIKYLGFVGLSDLLDLYKAADLLINIRPTKRLHTKYFFPSKMMEYLASGTPVLATCSGQTEEEFGQICYLLKDETPEALAQMIRNIATQPADLRRDTGMRARAYMKANKTWDSQARKVIRFICGEVLAEEVFSKRGERIWDTRGSQLRKGKNS